MGFFGSGSMAFRDYTRAIFEKIHSVCTKYGTCPTAAATAAKVITVEGGFSLRVGSEITTKFTYTNTANNPTFNVNSTGAKPVWYNTAAITTSSKGYAGTANRPMKFIYDGTYWVFIGWSADSNSDTCPSALCSTAAATAAKSATFTYYSLRAGQRFQMLLRYGNTHQGAVTLNVNSTGAKPLYINGIASSANNYEFASGVYEVYYDGENYHIRTDGGRPQSIVGLLSSQITAAGSYALDFSPYQMIGFSVSDGIGLIEVKWFPVIMLSGTMVLANDINHAVSISFSDGTMTVTKIEGAGANAPAITQIYGVNA